MSPVRALIKSLSFEEKLDLLGELWVEIYRERPEDFPELSKLLEQREAAYRANPGAVLTREEAFQFARATDE